MSKTRKRLPDYSTIVGVGTEIDGTIRFSGGLHIDGKVIGDVTGVSEDACALTLARSGAIHGDLDVSRVALDGVVVGNVRAAYRAELASGARIEGNLFYGALEMADGAEVNGKLLRIDDAESPQLDPEGAVEQQTGDGAESKENSTETPVGGAFNSGKKGRTETGILE